MLTTVRISRTARMWITARMLITARMAARNRRTQAQDKSTVAQVVKCTTNFTSFSGAYQFSLNQIFCNMREDLTLDELSNKINRLHDLRTSLLPSLKPQLVAILESLDLSEQPVYPCPNPELTAKILSELYSSIGKTISGVEYLALAPPLAKESHDGHLKELKRFRINRILWKTKAVIHENLCDLLETFGLWLLDWDRQEDREDAEF